MNNTTNKKRVGELRSSQLLHTFGVGALVDLPEISVMVAGLDDWQHGHNAMRLLVEDRLLAAVQSRPGLHNVSKFLTPPVLADGGNPLDPFSNLDPTGVPVITFPRWMVCPLCCLLAPLESGLFEFQHYPFKHHQTYYTHKNCNKAKTPPTAVPARFLVACEDGHLDDFPWVAYAHGDEGPCAEPLLRLYEQGPSGEARDLVVKCERCKKERRLAEAFDRKNRAKLPICTGRRPHLRDYDPAGCERHVRPLVLGASNTWFSVLYSSMVLPTQTARLDQLVQQGWARLQAVTSLEVVVAFRAAGILGDLVAFTDEEIRQAIERKRRSADAPAPDDPTDLKLPEWRVLVACDPALNTSDFRLQPEAAPADYVDVIEKVVLVERMREVQTLVGFTRLDYPGELTEPGANDEIKSVAPLQRTAPTWLPAIEVRGEGIFLQFKEEALRAWLSRPAVQEREREFLKSHIRWRRARFVEDPPRNFPGMRYILLHTIAHALMRQIAIEAGYSAAGIRERIYSRPPEQDGGPMAGILIYTAASDSEGTLGGLVSLGNRDSLNRHLRAALLQAGVCASDPICAEHPPSVDGISLHAAACHACLFAPETSCERGNKYLDRSALVPTFERADLAFFSEPDL